MKCQYVMIENPYDPPKMETPSRRSRRFVVVFLILVALLSVPLFAFLGYLAYVVAFYINATSRSNRRATQS
jgi:uncharacterized membrane protein